MKSNGIIILNNQGSIKNQILRICKKTQIRYDITLHIKNNIQVILFDILDIDLLLYIHISFQIAYSPGTNEFSVIILCLLIIVSVIYVVRQNEFSCSNIFGNCNEV